jgi:hypothetical protein
MVTAMRRETRLALKLVVQKAQKLRGGRYIQLLQEREGTKLTYEYKTDLATGQGAVNIEHIRPDDDATDALILTFRFFIQQRETASFAWLAKHVLDDPGLSDDWKQAFTDVRTQLNAFLDSLSPYNERVVEPPPPGSSDAPTLVAEHHYTHRQVMDVFIYGGMAHAELDKWEVLERWKANQLGFPWVQALFDSILMVGLHAISYVGYVSERELEAHDGAPPTEVKQV